MLRLERFESWRVMAYLALDSVSPTMLGCRPKLISTVLVATRERSNREPMPMIFSNTASFGRIGLISGSALLLGGAILLLHGPLRRAASAPALPGQVLLDGFPILDTAGSAAASGLQAMVGCSESEPRNGIAKLSWDIAPKSGSSQRVVMTIFRDGFITGRFQKSEPLASDETSLVWERLEPGIIHFWRVLTLQPDRWVASETATLDPPMCVADEAPRSTPEKQ